MQGISDPDSAAFSGKYKSPTDSPGGEAGGSCRPSYRPNNSLGAIASMSSLGKLSSYFTRRRGSSNAAPEESAPTASVRARLGKKLQVKQKSAFAFNFAIDSAADELPGGEACSEGGAGEGGSFRFGFNPTDTSDAAPSAPRETKARGVGGGDIPRAAQDFVVEVEGRRAQPNGKNKPKKKKGAGKKKEGARAKGKPADKVLRDPAGKEHPRQDSATKPPTMTVSSTPAEGGGEGRTSNDGASLAEASGVVGEERTKKNLRPPPGFTLESWKDPALNVEERRRRRFGSGVRNMAAIQRSSDARRGLVADGEVEGEDSRGTHRELVLPELDRGRGVGLVQPAASSGGPSVFSFGFNIDVSFNGGS